MFRILLTISAFLFACVQIFAQDVKPQNSDKTPSDDLKNDVLLTVEGKNFTADEFLYLYDKNNGSEYITEKLTVDEYLELFVNYKLKVREAEANQFHKKVSFTSEYQKYLIMLTEPYLSNSEVDENLYKEAYERMQYEVRSSHILIKVAADAPPADTLEAYKRAMRIRARLLKGEDFGRVAKMMSDDPSAKTNGGDIGYITAFQAVYPYESKIFNSEVGAISMPFRTAFGYHVVKVLDKRKTKPELKLQQIMINVRDESQLASAIETLDSVYALLKNGADFTEMAKQYSSSENIRKSGGNIGWLNYTQYKRSARSRFPSDFVDKVFNIKNDGDITKPFATKYGIHIVKRLDSRPIAKYDEMKGILKQKISQFPDRSRLSKNALIDKLKSMHTLEVDDKAWEEFALMAFDESLLKGDWKLKEYEEKTLFVINNEKFSTVSYASYVKNRQRKQTKIKDVMAYADILFQEYINISMVAYERKRLVDEHESVKYLAQEYYDGMLLFSISDSTVWSKANSDSAGLAAYYETVKEEYLWGKRVKVVEYSSDSELQKELLKKLIIKGQKKGWNAEQIAAQYKKKAKAELIYKEKKYVKGHNAEVDDIGWDSRATLDTKNGIIEIKGIVENEPKLLNEIRGEIVSGYQDLLEELWIKTLRNKFKFTVNQETLEKIKLQRK